MESKKPARKQAFLNLAPLTGIAFASNWLIFKLNLNPLSVKTTKMTTNSSGLRKAGLSEPRIC
ncbi:TPA: hypothetical protein IHD44_000327 [Escherichia coli]|nr:hypothetical protein [Escherichia coli]